MEFLFVALGGAAGAVSRYAISLIPVKSGFPILTLITNIIGAVLIGFIAGIAGSKNEISKNTRNNISTFFNKVIEKMETQTASSAWEEAIEEFSGNLNKEDKQTIKTLSKLLRNNRCWRSNKSNRSNRKFFRWTN